MAKKKGVLHRKVLLGRVGCTSRPAAPRSHSKFGTLLQPFLSYEAIAWVSCHFGAGEVTLGTSQCPLSPLAGPNRAPEGAMSPGRLGEAWSKGKYPALSLAQNPLGLIPKPPPRKAGQLRWEHASPAHSPPAFSQKILPLATGFGAFQIGAQR